MSNPDCLFCDKDNTKEHTIIATNDLAYARWDNFPVSDGHAEVIPVRHVQSFFDLSEQEVLAMHDLAKATRKIIVDTYHPDVFNLGINDGEAAGQTVHHVHLHIIPRYTGDVLNPQGGVRHIIPDKGSY